MSSVSRFVHPLPIKFNLFSLHPTTQGPQLASFSHILKREVTIESNLPPVIRFCFGSSSSSFAVSVSSMSSSSSCSPACTTRRTPWWDAGCETPWLDAGRAGFVGCCCCCRGLLWTASPRRSITETRGAGIGASEKETDHRSTQAFFTLGPAYNEFVQYEQPAITNLLFSQKWRLPIETNIWEVRI